MDAGDQIRREKFQRQKVALEMEMERERNQLSRRREEAAAKLAASKYADDGDDDVGGKKGEGDGNDGSLTSRKQYQKSGRMLLALKLSILKEVERRKRKT